MKARDIMHPDVVSILPDDSLLDAAKVMLERKISGLLVMDGGNLIGIVTEGDLVRRKELDTGRKRSPLREFFTFPSTLADEYVHMSGCKVCEVMTHGVYTASEDDDVQAVVDLMEEHDIKRVPVTVGRAVIGMITRSDLMRAYVAASSKLSAAPLTDEGIRQRLIAHLSKQKWTAPDLVGIEVKNGVVTLKGAVTNPSQMKAFEIAAENVPGVKRVDDLLIWVDPISGTGFDANNNII